MNKYIRFEIETHMPVARNHIVGIRLNEKGEERRDRLIVISTLISTEDSNIMSEDLCGYLNTKYAIK